LSDLTREGIKAVHEVGREVKKSGDYSFRLEPREIKVQNPQIRITKIEPEIIQITLDEVMAKKVPVKSNFVGEPAFGYKVEEAQIELSPNAVMVEGPKAQLEKIDSIKTEKIDLVGRVRSLRKTVTLDLPENIKLLSEPYIDVYVPIFEASDEKTFDHIPVRFVSAASGSRKAEIQPPNVSLVVRSSQKRFETLTAQDILAFVDVASLPPGEHALPVKVVLPEGVSFKEAKPLTVKVFVKK
jgi:YbbR domain-containing protein